MALHFIEINAKMQLIQGSQIFLKNLLGDTKISYIYVSNTEISWRLIRIYYFVLYLIFSISLDDKNVRFLATYFHLLNNFDPFFLTFRKYLILFSETNLFESHYERILNKKELIQNTKSRFMNFLQMSD